MRSGLIATMARRIWPGVGLLLASCMDPWALSPPEIRRMDPAPGSLAVETNARILLSWSAEMEPLTTARSLSVSADGAPVEGRTEWRDPSNLQFTPDLPFATGAEIRVQVDRGAEDVRGNNLSLPWQGRFQIQGDGGSPVVLAMEPGAGSVLERTTNGVTLTFSCAMDERSLRENLSVTPAAPWWLEGGTASNGVTVRFRDDLPWAWRVQVRVAAGAKAKNGRALKEAWAASFFVGKDLIAPDVEAVGGCLGLPIPRDTFAHGIEKEESIVITFSKAPRRDSVPSAFRFAPPLEGRWEWRDDTTVHFIPDGVLTPEGVYELVQGDGLVDERGNRSTNRGRWGFHVDGEGSRLLRVTNLSDGNHGSLPSHVLIPTPRWEDLTVHLSAPVHANDLLSAVNLSRVSGTGGYDFTVERLAVSPDGLRLVVTLSRLSSGNLYKFLIRNVKDRRGNPMAGDFAFFFVTGP